MDADRTAARPSAFDRGLKLTLGFEGGYSADQADRGGVTNYGVTQRTYDQWNSNRGRPLLPVTAIKVAEVHDLYRDEFWSLAHCDEMPEALACCVFDAAVNHGPTRAVILLQRALNVHPDMGIFGPQTYAAVEGCDEKDTIRRYLAERSAFYDDIVEDDPTQARFLNGWHNRIAQLRTALVDGGVA